MDNIQFEIKEKNGDIIELTETNKKVSFNNKVEIKTIPNNDQIKQQQRVYDETEALKKIYGNNLEKEKENQEKILADIKRQKQIDYFRDLNMQLANMRR